jgi:YHS domain-containing protein
MNHIWTAASVLVISVWGFGAASAMGQCCGGSHTEHSQPQATHPAEHAESPYAEARLAGGPALPACPVTDAPIDLSFRMMTESGPVYFSSEEAIKTFNENPAAYAERAAAQREALAKLDYVQVSCPVTGNPVDGKTAVSLDGQWVSFCSRDCLAKYLAAPADYQTNLQASYTYQPRYPVHDRRINPAVYADLSAGQRVYFCLKNDHQRFLKNLTPDSSRLAAQGIKIAPREPTDGGSKSVEPYDPKPQERGHSHSQQHGDMDHE